MAEKYKKGMLVAAFAALAGFALFEFVPRKVDVTVISKGTVSNGQGNIEERYLITDHGRVTMNDTSQFKIGVSQHATCVQSRDLLLNSHLHDCTPS
ncbi:MAG: hypothetical protein WA517_22675 [Candidatus Acidiferrum sp.]